MRTRISERPAFIFAHVLLVPLILGGLALLVGGALQGSLLSLLVLVVLAVLLFSK